MPTFLMVVVLGAFIGGLDLTNSEVRVTVGALLLGGFVVGLTRPRLAWLSASVLGISVPGAQTFAIATGFKPPYPNDWDTVLGGFLATIPATMGTYGGLLARSCWRWRGHGSTLQFQ